MTDASRLIVFDLDDTLYLEADYVRSGFHAVDVWLSHRHGIRGLFDQAWPRFQAGMRGRVFNEALESLGVSDLDGSLIGELVGVYRTHRPAIALLSDSAVVLAELRDHWPMAVVTDGPVESQRSKVSALGLSTWCDPIVLTSDLGTGMAKPCPEAFRVVQGRHGMRADQCIYVADNPRKDFSGPKSLGWATFRVRRAGGLHHDVASGTDVDGEASSLLEAARLLGWM